MYNIRKGVRDTIMLIDIEGAIPLVLKDVLLIAFRKQSNERYVKTKMNE